MNQGNPPDTLVPPSLVPEILAAAEEEHRDPRELVGEAIGRYLVERRFFPRNEVDRKIAQGLESLRRGESRDGETVMAELLAELDRSEQTR